MDCNTLTTNIVSTWYTLPSSTIPLTRQSSFAFIALGVFVILYSTCTDYELGFYRFLRIRFHLMLDGILGVSLLGLLACIDNSNGGLWLAFAGQYGDARDRGAYIASALNDGPFFSMLFLGASGLRLPRWPQVRHLQRERRSRLPWSQSRQSRAAGWVRGQPWPCRGPAA